MLQLCYRIFFSFVQHNCMLHFSDGDEDFQKPKKVKLKSPKVCGILLTESELLIIISFKILSTVKALLATTLVNDQL